MMRHSVLPLYVEVHDDQDDDTIRTESQGLDFAFDVDQADLALLMGCLASGMSATNRNQARYRQNRNNSQHETATTSASISK